MSYTLYIVCCADGTLYTGIATDVERRLSQHNGAKGKGARYTAARRPVRLGYSAPYPTPPALMCALTAGQRGRKVLLLDHADKVGAKILISGGGRCNFTNRHCTPDRFISANPHFHKSALDRYTQHDFIALVQRHRIAYHEKTLGQLFCDGSARAIVAMLMAECAAGHVDVRVAHRVTDISHSDQFRVD